MKTLLHFCSVIAMLFSVSAFAKTDDWFDGADLDFWNEGKRVHDVIAELGQRSIDTAQLPVTDSVIRSSDFRTFNWKNYEDPNSPEFWDDGGNYVPPRPFRVLAANPTGENLANYQAWVHRKLAVASRVGTLLGSLSSDSDREQKENKPRAKARATEVAISRPRRTDWSKVSIAFFYRSGCPFCAREVPVLESLRNKGARVRAYQIEPEAGQPIFRPSVPLSLGEVDRLHIQLTPTLVLSVGKRRARVEGFEDEEALTQTVEQLF